MYYALAAVFGAFAGGTAVYLWAAKAVALEKAIAAATQAALAAAKASASK